MIVLPIHVRMEAHARMASTNTYVHVLLDSLVSGAKQVNVFFEVSPGVCVICGRALTALNLIFRVLRFDSRTTVHVLTALGKL